MFETYALNLLALKGKTLVIGCKGIGKTTLANYLLLKGNVQIIDDVTEDHEQQIIDAHDVICFSRIPLLVELFDHILYDTSYIYKGANYRVTFEWFNDLKSHIDLGLEVEKKLQRIDNDLSKHQEQIIDELYCLKTRYFHIDRDDLSIIDMCNKGYIKYTSFDTIGFANGCSYSKYYYDKHVVGKGFSQNEFTLASIPQILATIKNIDTIFRRPQEIVRAFYKHIGERYGVCIIPEYWRTWPYFIIPGLIIIDFSKYTYSLHKSEEFKEACHLVCIRNKRNLDQVTVDCLAQNRSAEKTMIYAAKGSDKIVSVTKNGREVIDKQWW